jgi:hypothetical protein
MGLLRQRHPVAALAWGSKGGVAMRKHRELLWDAGLALLVLAAAAALVRYLLLHDPVRAVVEAEAAVAAASEERSVQVVERFHGKIVRDRTEPGNLVVAVDLSNTGLTDAGLKELTALKHLRTLDLTDSQVTYAGLKELAGLKQLQTLSIGTRQISELFQEVIREIQLKTRGQTFQPVHVTLLPKQLKTLYLNISRLRQRVLHSWLRELKDRLQKDLPGCRIIMR